MSETVINGKRFCFGDLYVVPWKIESWTTEPYLTTTLKDGEIVVIMDITEIEKNDSYPYFVKYPQYRIKILTTNGQFVKLDCSAASLDYWKTVQQTKKNKKF